LVISFFKAHKMCKLLVWLVFVRNQDILKV